MFWHPLVLIVISADIFALLLLLPVGIHSFNVVLDGKIHPSQNRPFILRFSTPTVSLFGRIANGIFLGASVLLIVGIANVFPQSIPGAMCGAGVFQAMKGEGARLLLYRGSVILIFQIWYGLDRLNRSHENQLAVETQSRFFLLILPITILAVVHTQKASAGMLINKTVDCCAVVYDQFRSLKEAQSISGIADCWWMVAFILLSTIFLGLSLYLYISSSAWGRGQTFLIISCLMWIPTAGLTLKNILSAYHYGVLHHHCPWCLFLPEYYMVGYPLYGSMMLVAMEGVLVFFLPRMTRTYPEVSARAAMRCQKSFLRIFIGGIVFLILSVGPAIVWRWHYGVWMGG